MNSQHLEVSLRELALEFRVEEVVELVQALFADSTHRKEAIREIKRAHVTK